MRALTTILLPGAGLLFAALFAGPLLAQLDAEAGRRIVMQGDGQGGAPCLACHGMDGAGNAAGGSPALYQLDADYMIKQLQDYQSGKRESVVMAPSVMKLTLPQMRAVAAFYSNQRPTMPVLPTLAGEQQAMGSSLVFEGDWQNYIVPCTTCHGPDSGGVGADFPALAGQHASYLEQQLLAWQNGKRGNDPDQLMQAIAARMSAQQVEAVAEYLARLPVPEEP